LNVPGLHNVLNAAAAVAVGLELEIDAAQIRGALAAYAGVDRRFQRRGEAGGVTVIDDYGHHPTEIRATLATARQCGYQRILVLFQPHRYSRTHLLMDEFAGAFHQADSVHVVDIYPASEQPIEGVTAEALYAGSLEEGVSSVAGEARPGDAILTLGAGSIARAGELLLRKLKEKR